MDGVTASAEDWGGALLALLPMGAAWPRDPESTQARLMRALGEEPARADARLATAIDEADPRSALELLSGWERIVGLPDACQAVSGSIKERRLAVVQRLTATGGQSRAYFIGMAAAMGLAVEISEFEPATADSDCTTLVFDDAWRFAWQVDVTDSDDLGDFVDVWATADSDADEYVRAFGSSELECRIRRARPAHTEVLFSYQIIEPLLWFDFLNP